MRSSSSVAYAYLARTRLGIRRYLDTTDESARRLRRQWVRRTAAVALVLMVLFGAATLRVLVFPKVDKPQRADAIFMLGGAGDRLDRALSLARAGYAPVLVISRDNIRTCPPQSAAPRVKIICFRPDPFTTRGEAREAGLLAQKYGWQKMIFVTDRSQDTRARLRIHRCYHGETLVSAVNVPAHEWLYLIAYQWPALAKALIWQRGC
jgi:hypothetical protein